MSSFFYRSTKMIFRALLNHYKDPNLTKFLKKHAKRSVFRHFWKSLTRKVRFFGARSPLKISYIGAKNAFRKILDLSPKNGYLKIIPSGEPLGRQGVESAGDWIYPYSFFKLNSILFKTLREKFKWKLISKWKLNKILNQLYSLTLLVINWEVFNLHFPQAPHINLKEVVLGTFNPRLQLQVRPIDDMITIDRVSILYHDSVQSVNLERAKGIQ